MVRLRLQRTGRRNYAQFRVVATDARRPRDGGAIEVLGFCDPHGKSEVSENVKLDRVDHWVAQGAQMSHSVKQIVRRVRKAQAGAQQTVEAPAAETKAPAEADA